MQLITSKITAKKERLLNNSLSFTKVNLKIIGYIIKTCLLNEQLHKMRRISGICL